MRIGNSIDFHPFKEGRLFILGGVTIPYDKGLDGVSDADPLLHSIAEAILGALALGDLGTYFKEEDSKNIENILKNDINFYSKMQLMDYSLLFIIIDYPNKIDPDYNQIIGFLDDLKYKGHVYKSDNEEYIYIVGIIDYLQKFISW